MQETSDYLGREVGNVGMPDAMRASVRGLCSNLASTKLDIFTELGEIDDLLLAVPPPGMALVRSRLDRLVRWIETDLLELHRLALAVREWADQDYWHRQVEFLTPNRRRMSWEPSTG